MSVGADGNCFFRALAQSSAYNKGAALAANPRPEHVFLPRCTPDGIHCSQIWSVQPSDVALSPCALYADHRILSAQEETKGAEEVRHAVVTALQDARDDIEPFLTMPWDVYCRNMRKSGTWGGALS